MQAWNHQVAPFWLVVYMLYCLTEKKIHYVSGETAPISLDVNIWQGSWPIAEFWRAPGGTVLDCIDSYQSYSLGTSAFFLMLTNWYPFKNREVHPYLISSSSLNFFFLKISFPLLSVLILEQTIPAAAHCLLFYLPCGNFFVYNTAGSRCGSNRHSSFSG